jgi:hypothetical protein
MKVANFLCSVVMSLLSHVNAVASIPILASMAVSCWYFRIAHNYVIAVKFLTRKSFSLLDLGLNVGWDCSFSNICNSGLDWIA